MDTKETFSSKAWLLDGPIHSIPGILHLEDERLTFLILEQGTFSNKRYSDLLTSHGAEQNEGQPEKPVQLFSLPTTSISSFKIPWYYFGSGAKIEIDNQSLRFSFIKPQNTVYPTYYSETFMQWRGGHGQNEVKILEGKSSGKRWKSLLT